MESLADSPFAAVHLKSGRHETLKGDPLLIDRIISWILWILVSRATAQLQMLNWMQSCGWSILDGGTACCGAASPSSAYRFTSPRRPSAIGFPAPGFRTLTLAGRKLLAGWHRSQRTSAARLEITKQVVRVTIVKRSLDTVFLQT